MDQDLNKSQNEKVLAWRFMLKNVYQYYHK